MTIPLPTRGITQIELEIHGVRHGLHHGLGCLLRHHSPTEVRMQHRAGEIENCFQRALGCAPEGARTTADEKNFVEWGGAYFAREALPFLLEQCAYRFDYERTTVARNEIGYSAIIEQPVDRWQRATRDGKRIQHGGQEKLARRRTAERTDEHERSMRSSRRVRPISLAQA
jgi:hypothetical protein